MRSAYASATTPFRLQLGRGGDLLQGANTAHAEDLKRTRRTGFESEATPRHRTASSFAFSFFFLFFFVFVCGLILALNPTRGVGAPPAPKPVAGQAGPAKLASADAPTHRSNRG